jgi:hypothetical protein
VAGDGFDDGAGFDQLCPASDCASADGCAEAAAEAGTDSTSNAPASARKIVFIFTPE